MPATVKQATVRQVKVKQAPAKQAKVKPPQAKPAFKPINSTRFTLPGVPTVTGVLYDTNNPAELKIFVPVSPMPSSPSGKQVFAPPFLIPKGVWNVIYSLPTDLPTGYVFKNVAYHDSAGTIGVFPQGVLRLSTSPGRGMDGTTFTDTIDTTEVPSDSSNVMGCTIYLNPSTSPNFLDSDDSIHGDPTIAVVSDPIGG